jgi:hypothetical protein
MLLEHRANVNTADDDGETPLHVSSAEGTSGAWRESQIGYHDNPGEGRQATPSNH